MTAYVLTREGDVPSVDELARMLDGNEFAPMPRARDREAWTAIARRPWIEGSIPGLLQRAEEAAASDFPQVKATDYLSYFRTDVRDAHNASAGRRSSALAALIAAECLEHEGRFLDALLDLSWATAEETSWIMPPHIRTGEMLPDAREPALDLRVAGVAALLAQMVYLLGPEMDDLSPMWRRRIVFEIERQAIDPYLRCDWHWERTAMNWNAVCNSGMVAAALLADFDTQTRARVLHKALGSVRRFLTGFTPDGGCSEGPGYWAYGVGNYAVMAYYVHCATGGGVDMLADPVLPAVFAYPTGIVLSGRKVANFADCSPQVGFRGGAIAWAAGRLGVPQMVALSSSGTGRRGYLTNALDLCLAAQPADFSAPPEFFLPDLNLLIARGKGADGEQLVLAVKGGHNAEYHNHNDVGAFIVHWRGESLICDLGAGNYVRAFFTDRRYEFLTTRSRGHNVPLINGVEQGTGSEFCATDFGLERSDGGIGVSMDLAGAYPAEAGVASLRRTVVLYRDDAERVELVDELTFEGDAGDYELPLYTEGEFRATAAGTVEARGENGALRVAFDPDVLDARVEEVEHGDARLAGHFGPVLSRCVLSLRTKGRTVLVRLQFVPAG